MLSLLGTAGFLAWMLPAASVVPAALHQRLRRLWWISGAVALLAGAGWFALQAAAIAGADTLADMLDALPLVARHTRYGNTLMVRLGLLAVATLLAARGPASGPELPPAAWTLYTTLVLSAVALGLQGVIGHAGATGGAIGEGLVVSESLHLSPRASGLVRCCRFGSACACIARQAPAASVCERFSPIGLACVLVLAGTGFAQGMELIGSLPALFGTTYGHIALLKIALFLLALAMAAFNRLWLTDRLAAGVARGQHASAAVGLHRDLRRPGDRRGRRVHGIVGPGRALDAGLAVLLAVQPGHRERGCGFAPGGGRSA